MIVAPSQSKHVLAVASGGGHWTQLRRLEPAFAGHRMSYVSTHAGYGSEVGDAHFHKVRNASRWDKFGLIVLALHMLWIVGSRATGRRDLNGGGAGLLCPAVRKARPSSNRLDRQSGQRRQDVPFRAPRSPFRGPLADPMGTPGWSGWSSIRRSCVVIFLTVGTQAPFDRLVSAVDDWAGENPSSRITAQIGDTKYRPRHFEWYRTIEPIVFRKHFETADHLIAHAGMGTIIDALMLGTPLLVLPRLAEHREHRSDHQVGTARRFQELGKVRAVFDVAELPAALDDLISTERSSERLPPHASGTLVDMVHGFIRGESPILTLPRAEALPLPAGGVPRNPYAFCGLGTNAAGILA